MPVVMLLLILMPLTMAGELCMLCQCLLLGRGRARRRLALLAGAVLLLLAVWLGGGALLETAGLGWRRWVRNLLVPAPCVLLFQGIWYGPQALGARPRGRGRWRECGFMMKTHRPVP